MSLYYTKFTLILAFFMFNFCYEDTHSNFFLASPERRKESRLNVWSKLSPFIRLSQSRDCAVGLLLITASEDLTKAYQTSDEEIELGNFVTSAQPVQKDDAPADDFQQMSSVVSIIQVLIVPFFFVWFLLRVRSIYFIGFLYHIINSISMVVNVDLPAKHKHSFGNKAVPDKLLGGGLEKEYFSAAKNGDTATLRRILASQPGLLNAKDVSCHNFTALHHVAENGHEAVARALLERGSDPSALDNEQWTPLHHAAYNGHEAVVRALLERGADPSACDDDQWTPLHFATDDAIISLLQIAEALRTQQMMVQQDTKKVEKRLEKRIRSLEQESQRAQGTIRMLEERNQHLEGRNQHQQAKIRMLEERVEQLQGEDVKATSVSEALSVLLEQHNINNLDDEQLSELQIVLFDSCTKVQKLKQELRANEELCCVCLSRKKVVVFMPCSHMCTCQQCSDALRTTGNKCPICTVSVTQRILPYK